MGSGLSARPRAFSLSGDDDLEISVLEGVFSEHSKTVVHEACIGVLCYFSRVVVETHPCGRHHVGVDVVKEVLYREVFHSQIQSFVELLFDEVQIFGEEEDSFPWGEGDVFRRFVRPHVPPSTPFRG